MTQEILKSRYPCENIQAEFYAESSDGGKTCGELLKKHGVSRRLTVKLKRVEGGITRNGFPIRTCDPVSAGDVIRLKALDADLLEAAPELEVPVIYEDGDVIVFDKPAGMPVHPSARHHGDTLGNCFAAMFPGLTYRPINRLDKDTSGSCAAAKSAYSANFLSGKISKVYIAAVQGRPVPSDVSLPFIKWYETGGMYRIDAPIGRTGDSMITRMIRPDGKRAVTDYTIVYANDRYSLLRIELATGRTHQIRVHFSGLGCPLAGDDLYGGSREYCQRQALHCAGMSFLSPSDGRKITVSSCIPEDILALFPETDGKWLQSKIIL